MPRNIQDAALRVITALPAAGANNDSASIDLEQPTADTINEGFSVQVAVPDLPDLVDTKKVTITFQDSADDSSFAAIPELAAFVITAGAEGAEAASRTVRLPATARRYIRINQAVEAAGGNNTAVKSKLHLLF